MDLRPSERRWPGIPWEVEREIAALDTAEWCLNRPEHVEWWWEPLRQNRQPVGGVPTRITVDYRMVRPR